MFIGTRSMSGLLTSATFWLTGTVKPIVQAVFETSVWPLALGAIVRAAATGIPRTTKHASPTTHRPLPLIESLCSLRARSLIPDDWHNDSRQKLSTRNDAILRHRNDSHFRKTRFHRDIAVSTSSIPFSVRRTSTARRLRRAGVRPTIFRSSRACRVLPIVVGWPRTARASSEVRTIPLLYKTIKMGIAYFRFRKLTITGLRRDEMPLPGFTSRGENREFLLPARVNQHPESTTRSCEIRVANRFSIIDGVRIVRFAGNAHRGSVPFNPRERGPDGVRAVMV